MPNSSAMASMGRGGSLSVMKTELCSFVENSFFAKVSEYCLRGIEDMLPAKKLAGDAASSQLTFSLFCDLRKPFRSLCKKGGHKGILV